MNFLIRRDFRMLIALPSLAFAGCTTPIGKPPMDGLIHAIRAEKGGYILTTTRKIDLGDIFSPSEGFSRKNIKKNLKGDCDGSSLELTPENGYFHTRTLGKTTASQLAVKYGLQSDIGFYSIDSANISISSGSRRILNFPYLTECVTHHSDLPERIHNFIPPDGEIVTEVIAGSYTVSFLYKRAAGITAPVAHTTFTWETTYDQTGEGPILFHTASLVKDTRSLVLREPAVWFHGQEVFRSLRIEEKVGEELEWRIDRLDYSGGFICFPRRGKIGKDGIGKLYIVRLPRVAFSDERTLSLVDSDNRAESQIYADTKPIHISAYLNYRPISDDPPEAAEIIHAIYYYYSGRFEEASKIMNQLIHMHPELDKEPAFAQIHDQLDNYLRMDKSKLKAVSALYRHVAEFFDSDSLGIGSMANIQIADEALQVLRNDPKTMSIVIQDKFIHSALAQNPPLRIKLKLTY